MSNVRERLSEKAARNRVPIMSAFELLPVCNLKCKMCYVRKPMSEVKAAGGLKDAQWWLDHARQARDCGLLYPLLTGGEPFLYPELFPLLHGLGQLGLQVSINSNGTLIDRETAIRLKKDRPVRINLTLYGASEQSYQNLCGDGDGFRRMVQGVKFLKEYDIPVKFNASITPENVKDLEGMIAFAKAQNSPIQVATYMFPPIRRDSTQIGQNDRLEPEAAARARVHADFLQNDPNWFVMQASRYGSFVPLEQIDFEACGHESMGMMCRAGLCSYWVDWQGNLMNCGMYGSAAVKMEGRPFQEAWRELTDLTAQVRYCPPCTRCPNKHLCHPCIAMVSNETGGLTQRPVYMCEMNQALAKCYKEYVDTYYPGIEPGGNAAPTESCEL